MAPQPPCCICKASSASGTAVAATVVSSGTVVCSGTVVSSGTAVCSADVDSAGAGWKVPMARHCSRAVTRRSKDSKVEENVLRWEEHGNLGRTTSDAFAKPFSFQRIVSFVLKGSMYMAHVPTSILSGLPFIISPPTSGVLIFSTPNHALLTENA